jgi:YidC/Oxa1 family membrane protein insertase
MRSLQPQVKAIQERYAGDQERIQLETARLYKLSGVDPLAGCLPTLVTIPVWIGLYRALSNVANEVDMLKHPFCLSLFIIVLNSKHSHYLMCLCLH